MNTDAAGIMSLRTTDQARKAYPWKNLYRSLLSRIKSRWGGEEKTRLGLVTGVKIARRENAACKVNAHAPDLLIITRSVIAHLLLAFPGAYHVLVRAGEPWKLATFLLQGWTRAFSHLKRDDVESARVDRWNMVSARVRISEFYSHLSIKSLSFMYSHFSLFWEILWSKLLKFCRYTNGWRKRNFCATTHKLLTLRFDRAH